VLQCTISCR